MTLQIIKTKCAICNQPIQFDPTIRSPKGSMIPINPKDGTYHDEWHVYIYRKAKQIRQDAEFQNAMIEELNLKEEF